MNSIRVLVAGIEGKMGSHVAMAVHNASDMVLVGGIENKEDHTIHVLGQEIPVYRDIAKAVQSLRPDVLVDFTHAQAAQQTVLAAIEHGVRPVVGTTGFTEAAMEQFVQALDAHKIGAVFAPNFAIGALLMIRAAEMAARYLPYAEIVEYHHEGKLDAPSGTAKKTALQIASSREEAGVTTTSLATSAALHTIAGTPIHSVRLPGFVAHQEVIFGHAGERLTIRHDSISRDSFMPGVLLAVRQVMNVTGLIDGLEHLLF